MNSPDNHGFDKSNENKQASETPDDDVQNAISMRGFSKERSIGDLLIIISAVGRHRKSFLLTLSVIGSLPSFQSSIRDSWSSFPVSDETSEMPRSFRIHCTWT